MLCLILRLTRAFPISLLVFFYGCASEPKGPPPAEQAKAASETTPARVEPTPTAPGGAENPADVTVAVVGPYKITLADLTLLTKEREAAAQPAMATMTVTDVRRRIRKEHLEEMVERRLLILGSKEHPEWVKGGSVELEVKKRLAELGPDEVERRRKIANVPKESFLEEFRRYVREELMQREILRREVNEKVVVTDEEVRERYERDREKTFHRPQSWAVHHIDRFLPRGKAAELPALMERMEALRSEVASVIASATAPRAKADLMVPFVKAHSEAPDAQTGYAYIYDTEGLRFDPEFVNRVRGSTPGELSPVFELAGDETRVGACFFLTFDRKEGVYTPTESALRTVKALLRREKGEALHNALFERLRRDYPVRVFEDRLFSGLEDASGQPRP
ncbi:MAG: hypothetical protein GHCLOJNM_02149 [bacterium]|nr:hypothetical protein [bacterium]